MSEKQLDKQGNESLFFFLHNPKKYISLRIAFEKKRK